MINSHDEMSAMMEVTCNDNRKPFLEKIVTETGYWPSWMNNDQIQYVQENGFNMEPIQETNNWFSSNSNFFITENDIYCNMGKFLKKSPNQVNICFVTGFSGSGKSTLGKKMANHHKITYVELDYMSFRGSRRPFTEKECKNNGQEILWKYIKANHISPDFMTKVDQANPAAIIPEVVKYVSWLETQPGNYVIEGVQCAFIIPANPKWYNYPIIFKGTSMLTSFIRGLKRDEIVNFGNIKETVEDILHRLQWYYRDKSSFDNIRNVMITKDNHREVPASAWDDIGESYVSESTTASLTKLPYKTELKYCYHTMQGPTKKGIPNLILHKNGKNYRVRAELILFKGNEILLSKEDKPNQYGTLYKLPGGGIDDPNESIESAASRECEEEVLIIPKNVRYTGIENSKLYTKTPEWHKVCFHPDGIYYDGFMSFICTGEYDKKYSGYVKVMDRDVKQASKARFYKYEEVKDLLLPVHQKVIEKYLKIHDINEGYGIPTFVTRETPVNEFNIMDTVAKGVSKLTGSQKEENKCDYPNGPESFRAAKIRYKKNISGKYTKLDSYIELVYFKYPENLLKNIAKKYASPSSEFFVHSSNPFGNKHLGEFMVGGDDGFAYCPELNKWYKYDIEKKVPIDINKPISFSYIQSFAKKDISEGFIPTMEAMFRDKKNLEYRFDQWVNGQITLLFITGFSGSGKTTLAEQLSRKYHCKLISVDIYGSEVKRRHPELNDLPKVDRQRAVVNYIIEEFKDKRTIIEGAQIAQCDPELIKAYACIFMGTSFTTSTARLWRRGFVDTERESYWAGTKNPVLLFLHALFKSGPKNTYANLKFHSAMSKMEDALSESAEVISEGESIQSSSNNLNDYAEKFKTDGLIIGYDIYGSKLIMHSASGKFSELEDRVKASIDSLGEYSYSVIKNRGKQPPGYPKITIYPKEATTESYVSEAKTPKKEPSVYYSKSEKDEIFREFQRTFNSSKYKAELLLDNMGQLGGRIPSPAIAIIHTRPGFDGDKSNISEICKEATKRSKKYVFKRQAIGSPAFAHFIRYDLPFAIPYPNLAYGIVAYPKSVEKKYRTAAYECFVTEGDLPSVEPTDEASVPLTRPVYTKKMHKKPVNRHITNSKGNHIKKIVSQENYTDWF